MENKIDIAANIRKQAQDLMGHNASIVPAGTATWVEGYVKTTQVDYRPKNPCVLVVIETPDKKLHRRVFGSPLLKVDLNSEIHETPSRIKVPKTIEELEETIKKEQTKLEALNKKIELLTKALETAKQSEEQPEEQPKQKKGKK